VILIINIAGSNGYEYAENETDGIEDTIDGQQLAADEQLPDVAAAPPRIEHQAGELRKGDIPPKVDIPDEPPREPIEHDNEWVDFSPIIFEYYGGEHYTVIMYYELRNMYELGVEMRDFDVFLNGEYTGMWFSTQRVDRDSSTLNSIIFWERDNRISVGDTIVISALVSVNDTNDEGRWVSEELGYVEFTFTVGEIDAPGSNVTTPGHMSSHEDISLVITDIDLREATDWAPSRPSIEFVMTNPTEQEVAFDEAEVFINGVQLTEDEFWGLFLHANPGFASRRTLNMEDVDVELGDTITIRGRLRVAYSATEITQETVEFTFVL
jgi:hypothetical protein